MSDELVQRLRAAQHNPYGSVRTLDQRSSIAGDAADEIERLRNVEIECESCRGEIERLRAEVVELRGDRDSWREQAEDRMDDWTDMRDRATTAESALAALRMQYDSLKGMMHDEIAANLAFREAGGALPDEDMPTFCARLISERSTPQPPPAGSVGVPEGWQLVPKEPTEAMMAAAWNHTPLEMDDMTDGYFGQAYRDMLSAAPPPPQQEKGS